MYVQGSGGNLLSRTLSMSENTIPCCPVELASSQHELTATAEQRLTWYNNWNSHNWTESEQAVGIWYHSGLNSFVNYERSSLKLIDQFHPADFAHANNANTLWTKTSPWSNIIFIKWREESSLAQLKLLADKKRPDLSHVAQMERIELSTYAELLKEFSQHSSIYWEDMLQLDSYLSEVTVLAERLGLTLNYKLVELLYNNWQQQTMEILNA